MKKLTALLILAAVTMCLCPAFAEDVTFGAITVDKDAEYVDLGKYVIGMNEFDSFYAFLDRLPRLKKVDMFATVVWANRIGEMAERYPDVEFGWTMGIMEHRIRTDQTAFSTLHSSHTPTHSERDFAILKYCKNLLALDIGHNSVKDLSFLYDLPKLRVLIIGRNPDITDITPIGSLKDLEYLEMFSLMVSDISPLSGLEHLIDLDIAYNMIGDYSPLYGMTQLKRLWLYNSNNYNDEIPVPYEVVNELRERLPDCEIDAENHPTGGTWRKHERYSVIKKMFYSGEYIPFAQ